MKLNFVLHGPPPDGALMPPQDNRCLSDGKISFDNLPSGFPGPREVIILFLLTMVVK